MYVGFIEGGFVLYLGIVVEVIVFYWNVDYVGVEFVVVVFVVGD